MEDQAPLYESVKPGEIILKSTGDYVQVPAGEPLEAHIDSVEKTKVQKFESDEMEEKLVIGFTLDQDIDGKGQVYTGWYRPSLNPKSKLFPLLVAIYSGNIPSPVDITDLVGRPLRVVLTKGVEKNGRTRQYVESYLKPTETQKRVEVKADKDVVIKDIPDSGIDVDALFE